MQQLNHMVSSCTRPSLLQSLLQSFYLPKFLLNLPSLPFLALTECDGGWFHWLHQFHWRLRCGFGWWNGYCSRHRGDTRSVLHIFSRFGLLLFLGHPLSLLCTSSVVVTHTMAEIALLHDWCCHCSLFWEAPATAISMERGRAIKEPNFLAKITWRDHLKRFCLTRADVQNNKISVSKWDSNKAIQNIGILTLSTGTGFCPAIWSDAIAVMMAHDGQFRTSFVLRHIEAS